jgi:hypothetical protein
MVDKVTITAAEASRESQEVGLNFLGIGYGSRLVLCHVKEGWRTVGNGVGGFEGAEKTLWPKEALAPYTRGLPKRPGVRESNSVRPQVSAGTNVRERNCWFLIQITFPNWKESRVLESDWPSGSTPAVWERR